MATHSSKIAVPPIMNWYVMLGFYVLEEILEVSVRFDYEVVKVTLRLQVSIINLELPSHARNAYFRVRVSSFTEFDCLLEILKPSTVRFLRASMLF